MEIIKLPNKIKIIQIPYIKIGDESFENNKEFQNIINTLFYQGEAVIFTIPLIVQLDKVGLIIRNRYGAHKATKLFFECYERIKEIMLQKDKLILEIIEVE